MKTVSLTAHLLILALASSGIASAGENAITRREELVCSPANPAEATVLRVEIPWQKLHITGIESKEIRAIVTYPIGSREATVRTSVDGMRRLSDGTETAFQMTSRENDVWLSGGGKYQWVAEFDIKVPMNTRLILRAQSGGDIEVENVSGDVEISNSMGGGVVLRQVTGAAVVEVVDGDIEVSYKEPPAKPASFTSRAGEILLRLPPASKSTMKFRAHTGAIYTDFSADSLRVVEDTSKNEWMAKARASTSASKSSDPRTQIERAQVEATRLQAEYAKFHRAQSAYYVSGGKKVAYALNGGGIEILASTVNGAITLRQAP